MTPSGKLQRAFYRCEMSQVAEEQDSSVDIEEQFESSRRFLDEWLVQLREPGFCPEPDAAASQRLFQACHVRAGSLCR